MLITCKSIEMCIHHVDKYIFLKPENMGTHGAIKLTEREGYKSTEVSVFFDSVHPDFPGTKPHVPPSELGLARRLVLRSSVSFRTKPIYQ